LDADAASHAPCGLGKRLQARVEGKAGRDSKIELEEEETISSKVREKEVNVHPLIVQTEERLKVERQR